MIGRSPDRSWVSTLDALERHVEVAERLASGQAPAPTAEDLATPDWETPRLEGLVPALLVDRALALLARQEAVREELERALERNRREVAELGRPATDGRRRGPAYVDISA